MGLTVRKARKEDAYIIGTMAYSSFNENNLKDLDIETDYNKGFSLIVEKINEGLVYVGEDQGTVIGVLGLTISELWFSKKEFLACFLLFIRPDKRLKSIKLIKELLRTALSEQNKQLLLDLFVLKDYEKKRKLFLALGFKDCGTYLLLDNKEI